MNVGKNKNIQNSNMKWSNIEPERWQMALCQRKTKIGARSRC